MMREVIRADEAHHRQVNYTLSSIQGISFSIFQLMSFKLYSALYFRPVMYFEFFRNTVS